MALLLLMSLLKILLITKAVYARLIINLFTISQSHRPTKLFTISNLMSAPTTLETLHYCSADLPHLIMNLYCALKFDSCDLVSSEFLPHHSLTYFPPTSFLFLCDLHQHLLHSSIQLLSFVGYHAISFLSPIY